MLVVPLSYNQMAWLDENYQLMGLPQALSRHLSPTPLPSPPHPSPSPTPPPTPIPLPCSPSSYLKDLSPYTSVKIYIYGTHTPHSVQTCSHIYTSAHYSIFHHGTHTQSQYTDLWPYRLYTRGHYSIFHYGTHIQSQYTDLWPYTYIPGLIIPFHIPSWNSYTITVYYLLFVAMYAH